MCMLKYLSLLLTETIVKRAITTKTTSTKCNEKLNCSRGEGLKVQSTFLCNSNVSVRSRLGMLEGT